MHGAEELWGTPVIRTDFADEAAWVAVCEALQKPEADSGYEPNVTCRSDPRYAGLTAEGVAALLPHGPLEFMFIVDRLTLTHPERPLLVVDLGDAPGRSFRTIPSEVATIEANLSLANMDFADFADHAAATWPDGIHRGFQ